ncbi:MAG: bifunctional methylenetetrahydrofolate dehydrogenase/methenyltetrahydrofolate cyclohydrolase FolD [Candidatus Fermentibacteraceae bacterium]|nr:bifunctional methylenetetrahydrofolate dehydrogenase/methenyltetrahydrofolate cyclohydrolase FolD [Candidatus Fermentibacteraceae bacterium]MBN2608715.1 bifunctional methylenetetrahydrofolate dehydrogenase/methenyltetrahydrofolate cyclohydrolase FolD [Candidatus Fermentibacteraceae bacterium]
MRDPVVLSGRELASEVRKSLALEITATAGRPPGLAVVMVGDDPASGVYVSMKEKACAKAGISSSIARLPGTATQDELLREIERLNGDDSVDGILCQLPLPGHLSPDSVASAILPWKDVDGFHPVNVGKLWRGEEGLFPCTPVGITAMLDHYGIAIDGARAVIVGRSNIVGKPMAALLLRRHSTVTVAHSHTPDLQDLCSTADILIAAVGKPRFITPDFVKYGATVIDVGTSRTADGLSGDVDYEPVLEKCGAITPVPGGVGPLTIAFLLSNTVAAWRAARIRG